MRVGCCAYSYRDFLTGKKKPAMTMEDFINRMADLEIDGVELTSYYFPSNAKAADIRKIGRRCFLLGIEVNGTAIGNSFTVPLGDERIKQIDLVKTWIDYAADMGAPCARIFAGNMPKDRPEEEVFKSVIDCIETCCDYASSKGVMLALENHGGIVADAEGVIKIMKAVNSEWFGMKWDSGNFHTADPYADLTKTAPYAITTHMKTEFYPGNKKQDADLERVVKILKDANYRGYLHLEYEGTEDPLVAVPRTLKRLKELV